MRKRQSERLICGINQRSLSCGTPRPLSERGRSTRHHIIHHTSTVSTSTRLRSSSFSSAIKPHPTSLSTSLDRDLALFVDHQSTHLYALFIPFFSASTAPGADRRLATLPGTCLSLQLSTNDRHSCPRRSLARSTSR